MDAATFKRDSTGVARGTRSRDSWRRMSATSSAAGRAAGRSVNTPPTPRLIAIAGIRPVASRPGSRAPTGIELDSDHAGGRPRTPATDPRRTAGA